MARKFKRLIDLFDWIGRAQTLIQIMVAFGAATLLSAILRLFSVVSGLWLVTVGSAAFALIMAILALAIRKGWLREMEEIPPNRSAVPQGPQVRTSAVPVAATPNVIFLRAETTRIRFSDGGEIFNESKADTDAFGIIACFRNEPSVGRRVANTDYVHAQLVYRDKEGHEIGNGVTSACWLGEATEIVEFNVGQSHCVLLGLFLEGELLVPYKRRKHHWDGDVMVMQDQIFRSVSLIEIRLIAENSLLLPPLLMNFSVADGKPIIARM